MTLSYPLSSLSTPLTPEPYPQAHGICVNALRRGLTAACLPTCSKIGGEVRIQHRARRKVSDNGKD